MRDYDGRKSPIITRERRSIELNTRDCFYVRFPHKTVENSTLETPKNITVGLALC